MRMLFGEGVRRNGLHGTICHIKGAAHYKYGKRTSECLNSTRFNFIHFRKVSYFAKKFFRFTYQLREVFEYSLF